MGPLLAAVVALVTRARSTRHVERADEIAAEMVRDVTAHTRAEANDHLDHHNAEGLATLGAVMHSELARLEEEAFEAFPFAHACRRDCAHCCSLRTYASVPELLWLARWLRAHLTPAQLDALRRRVRAARARVASLDHEAHFDARVTCPLLGEQGECTAYDARPIACRTHFSADASACARPSDALVPMHRPSKLIGAGASIGLALGAADHDLDSALIELTAGLDIALRRGAEKRWLASARLFDEARRADPEPASHLSLPVLPATSGHSRT